MTKDNYSKDIAHLGLGKATEYKESYDPSLLQSVPRKLNRDAIELIGALPFTGEDLWNGYEFSYLNKKGKPLVFLLQCRVPAESPNLIESKSFKLYLNSFNQTAFASCEEVFKHLESDLSLCAGAPININLESVAQSLSHQLIDEPAECIDDLDLHFNEYHPNSSLLRTDSRYGKEYLCSHLLKSNCLITNQPDWGSVYIKYEGKLINHSSLLKYIVSFRQHNEFHEQCVERIFCDILRECSPEKLTVCARYTRRGGLDINPFRSNFEAPYQNIRQPRQ